MRRVASGHNPLSRRERDALTPTLSQGERGTALDLSQGERGTALDLSQGRRDSGYDSLSLEGEGWGEGERLAIGRER